MGECEEIQGEAGECRPNTNAERSFEKQVVVNFAKINFVTKAIDRPPVSQFIREITRATEEDRKRRYAMRLCHVGCLFLVGGWNKDTKLTFYQQGVKAAKTEAA